MLLFLLLWLGNYPIEQKTIYRLTCLRSTAVLGNYPWKTLSENKFLRSLLVWQCFCYPWQTIWLKYALKNSFKVHFPFHSHYLSTIITYIIPLYKSCILENCNKEKKNEKELAIKGKLFLPFSFFLLSKKIEWVQSHVKISTLDWIESRVEIKKITGKIIVVVGVVERVMCKDVPQSTFQRRHSTKHTSMLRWPQSVFTLPMALQWSNNVFSAIVLNLSLSLTLCLSLSLFAWFINEKRGRNGKWYHQLSSVRNEA